MLSAGEAVRECTRAHTIAVTATQDLFIVIEILRHGDQVILNVAQIKTDV